MSLTAELQAKCRAKKDEQTSRIPKDWTIEAPSESTLDVTALPITYGILTPEEIEITELDDVDKLLSNLAQGVWTSVAVTTAYCKRAIIAHQLVNCLTEFWIDEALQRAKELDEELARNGPVGPLHGLPISLKDQFGLAGKETNMGIASWLGHISKEDAALVKMLRKAGCVVYVRTNVPMTLLLAETINHVYGLTTNPRNRTLTCGGSSGGEGALIALKGSPLGIGTDIGGSVRIPSHMNSLYGLRPTMRRLPYWGASNTLLGQDAIESSLGPMSRTLSGCKTLFKAVVDGEPWNFDTKSVEIPWRPDMYALKHIPDGKQAKLCFGYYDDDGVVRCQPPVRRAVREMIEALRAAGHTVIPWKPIDHEAGIWILRRIFASGVLEEFERHFGESLEPLVPGIDDYPSFAPCTVRGYWDLCEELGAYRKRYLDAFLATAAETGTGRPLDGIICPVAPFPPPPHGGNVYFGYTGIFNTLDLPSVTIPVTFVDPKLDVADTDDFEPRNDIDAKVRAQYTGPEVFKNAPVGLQIVGRRWREEELLAIAEIVDEAVRARRG